MRRTRTIDGFSYVEVLVAAALIAAAIVPAMQSLSDSLWRSGQVETAMQDRHHLRSAMEAVLAEPYQALLSAAEAAGDASTPTSYSDAPGASRRRLVYIARYDGDASPFTVPDPDLDGDGNPFTGYRGLLWIHTAGAADGGSLESLRAN